MNISDSKASQYIGLLLWDHVPEKVLLSSNNMNMCMVSDTCWWTALKNGVYKFTGPLKCKNWTRFIAHAPN